MKKQDYESKKYQVLELMEQGLGRDRIGKALNIHPSKARRWMKKAVSELSESEAEALKHAVKLSRSKQALQDKNRIREKVLRESFRVENAIENFNQELINVFKNNKITKINKNTKIKNSNAIGIIHISDTHFNELINIENVNKYDFNIASKRLKLLADRARKYFSINNIDTVLIAMTGDIMNSDRRLDELLSMATNRSNATFLAVDILQQFITEIAMEYTVKVAYVTGNESRVSKDIGWSKIVATDNYDSTVFNILKYIFKDIKPVEFVNGDSNELVISVGNSNILMIHGHGSIKKDIEKSVEQIKGRYASRGCIIDYVIFGHLHSASVGDNYARCSSLAGANAYSEECLNLTGRASQNIYVIHENKLIDGMKVDLQITDGPQYDINDSLAAYNCKSESKTKSKTKIFEIII